jgi:biotin transport system substrate-specific component
VGLARQQSATLTNKVLLMNAFSPRATGFGLDVTKPAAVTSSWGQRALRVALGACLLAAASRLHVPFVGTPVPFTLAPQMALGLGAALGPAEGVGAVMAWLLAGLLGAPVFASGLVGPMALLAPSGGYMAGYAVAAGWVGCFGQKATVASFAAWLSGALLILLAGTAGLAAWLPLGQAWASGFVPFAACDLYKTVLVFAATWMLRRRD